MLTQDQKSEVRRHLGYESVGILRTDSGLGIFGVTAANPYFSKLQQLEDKMTYLAPVDEAKLTGTAYGAVALPAAIEPATGNQLSVTITSGDLGSPVTLLVTAASGETRVTLLQKMVQAGAINASLVAARIVPQAPYGGGQIPLQPEIAFNAQNTFTLVATGTGQVAPVITSQGVKVNPQATVAKNTVLYGYLPILSFLEGAIAGATQNLDTAKAETWTSRHDEIDQRKALYREWQRRLSQFIGVPVNSNSTCKVVI